MKKAIILALVAIALIAAGVAVVHRKREAIATLPKPEGQPQAVETATAVEGTLEVTSHQLGMLQAFTQADLAPRITGHILSITKREGDAVAEGEVVCVVDDRELADRAAATQAEVLATRERLAGARSVYQTQRSIYDRDEKLFTVGAISQEALERSRAALDSAKAAVGAYEESIKGLERTSAAARLQTAYAQVVAPFSGVVTKRWAEPGDLAVPGKPVLSIERASPVRVVVQVPQEGMLQARKGMKVYLTNGAERLPATVSQIYPALGRNLLGSLEILLPRPPFGLPTGSTVGVDLVTASVHGTLVPENALARTEQGTFAYLVQNGTVRIRQVQVLGSAGGKAAVKGPIPSGAVVAVAQENRLLVLSDGMKVTTAGGKP
jgi:RND family efflux transporter MFP subunit